VTQAGELTGHSVFVVTDEDWPVGKRVEVDLSFPRLMAPVGIHARVVGQRVTTHQPGDLGGVLLEFIAMSVESRARLDALLEREREHAPDRPRARAEHGRASAGPYRVLLVEDSDFIHDLFAYGIARYFRQKKAELHLDRSGDAETAWTKLTTGAYDLVIVDYLLPAEDGAGLIARMKRVPALAYLPIVAISVAGAEAREATLSAGADLFLDKPIAMRDLFATLERLADLHTPAAPPVSS
jgi:CheY-like chemotaxis protein